ncbi:hypothetical protein [Agromyces sp. NPDC058126]|uniref:hypothetical protein n=1 Tax=Agromyces sp. NPDC058126 TaxID=3346350 RepID=UPI0036DC6F47
MQTAQLAGNLSDAVVITGIGAAALSALSDAPAAYRLVRASGLMTMGVGTDLHTFGDSLVPDVSLAESLDGTGEWLGVFHSFASDELAIGADFVGYAQIYYSLIERHPRLGRAVVVGLTLRSVVTVLAELGERPGLDVSQMLPSLVASNNLFRTRWSSSSFASGVGVLRSNELIVAGPHGFGIVSRPMATSSSDDYATLIERGFSRSVDSIVAATRSDLPVVLSLSGGKDSRALLAFALAGGVASDIRISTLMPSGGPGASRDVISKDLSIASRLVERYGLGWWDQGTSVQRGVTFEENVAHWQDYRGNNSFEMHSRASVTEPIPRWSLVGIGGELLRSYIGADYRKNFPGWWSRAGKGWDDVAADAAALFDIICPNFDIDAELYAESRRAFSDALALREGDGIIAQLDQGYFEYRNRCHGGSAHYQLPFGSRTIYPLVQPEFIAASRLQGTEEAEGGRVLFDLIATGDPELHDLDYASPPWPGGFRTASATASDVWEGFDGRRAMDSLVAARSALPSPRRLDRPEPYAFERSALERIGQNLEPILDALHLGHAAEHGLTGRIARTAQFGDNLVRVLLAATETAADVLQPGAAPTRVLRWDLGAGTPPQPTTVMLDDRSPWGGSRPVEAIRLKSALERIDLSGVTGSVATTRAGAAVRSVEVRIEGLRAGSEAACYLHVGGKRIATEWYKVDPLFRFDVEGAHEGTVRAEVFLRWIGDPVVQRLLQLGE